VASSIKNGSEKSQILNFRAGSEKILVDLLLPEERLPRYYM
jgi:hypothetical protein